MRGLILAVLVMPVQGVDPVAYRKLIEDIVVLESGRARVLSHATKLVPAGVQS